MSSVTLGHVGRVWIDHNGCIEGGDRKSPATTAVAAGNTTAVAAGSTTAATASSMRNATTTAVAAGYSTLTAATAPVASGTMAVVASSTTVVTASSMATAAAAGSVVTDEGVSGGDLAIRQRAVTLGGGLCGRTHDSNT